MRNVTALLVGSLLVVSSAQAGRVDHVAVGYDKGVYQVAVSSWIALSQAELVELLTDYEKVSAANEAIKEVTILPSPAEGVTRLAATLEVCVWFYCKKLKQVQDMTLVSAGLLEAKMLPEQSDYKFGEASWHMITEHEGTRLMFNVAVEPDFWVPPLIGPMVIKRKMREEAVETVEGIEALAQHDG